MRKKVNKKRAFYIIMIWVLVIVGIILLSAGGRWFVAALDSKDVEVETVEVVEITESPVEEVEPTAPIGDSIPLSYELQQAVLDNCAEYNLDPYIILAIIQSESGFRETADNGICYGLMQIHKGNASWVNTNAGVTDIYDPAQNIRAGCWILYKGLEIHGDLEKALIWYNAGSVYADSTPYSRLVISRASEWKKVVIEERVRRCAMECISNAIVITRSLLS